MSQSKFLGTIKNAQTKSEGYTQPLGFVPSIRIVNVFQSFDLGNRRRDLLNRKNKVIPALGTAQSLIIGFANSMIDFMAIDAAVKMSFNQFFAFYGFLIINAMNPVK